MFSGSVSANIVESIDGCCVQYMIPPHLMFGALFKASVPKFKTRLGASKSSLLDFWRMFLSTPDGIAYHVLHPGLRGKTPEDLNTTIPFYSHNDAGPCSRAESAYILNVSSFFASGSELETHFLVATWISGHSDLPEGPLWSKLKASFDALSRGEYLGADGGGATLLAQEADGTTWKGLWLTHLCDAEYSCNELGFQGASHNLICSWCPAGRSLASCPWTALGSSAAWRSRRFNNRQFLARLRRGHGLLEWPEFNMYSVRLDVLHVLDYRGVAGKVYGSTLWAILKNPASFARVFPDHAGSREDRLAALNSDLRSWMRQKCVTHRLPKITMRLLFSSESPSGFPDFTGPAVKAANTRACVGWLASLATRFDDGSLEASHRRTVCVSLVSWYLVIYSAGVVLNEDQYREQYRLVQRCLRSYTWLAFDSATSGRQEWHLVPKFHWWAEMAHQARFLNPRHQQTYAGESMVGRICNIYKRSMSGPYRNTVQRSVLRKYALGFVIDVCGLAGIKH